MEIALEEAARANLCLPTVALVKQFYVALKAQGGGRYGTQALIKVLEQMNNHSVNGKKDEWIDLRMFIITFETIKHIFIKWNHSFYLL